MIVSQGARDQRISPETAQIRNTLNVFEIATPESHKGEVRIGLKTTLRIPLLVNIAEEYLLKACARPVLGTFPELIEPPLKRRTDSGKSFELALAGHVAMLRLVLKECYEQ